MTPPQAPPPPPARHGIAAVFRLLMMPATVVCNRIGLTNVHDRGMMRMLVNMMLCSAVAAIAVFVGWKIWA